MFIGFPYPMCFAAKEISHLHSSKTCIYSQGRPAPLWWYLGTWKDIFFKRKETSRAAHGPARLFSSCRPSSRSSFASISVSFSPPSPRRFHHPPMGFASLAVPPVFPVVVLPRPRRPTPPLRRPLALLALAVVPPILLLVISLLFVFVFPLRFRLSSSFSSFLLVAVVRSARA